MYSVLCRDLGLSIALMERRRAEVLARVGVGAEEARQQETLPFGREIEFPAR